MKKALLLLLSIVLILASWHCGRKKIEENKVLIFDLDNCKTEIDLKLSNLADSCRLIPLETTNESLLGDWIRVLHIGKEFIIILENRSGIYKFRSDGKFVRKLVSVGRGPGEISASTSTYFYQETENILFIEDELRHPDNILRYDIKNEVFLSPIEKCFKGRWSNFIVYEDTLLMGSIEGLSRGETNPYALFIQNFKGKFISGIKSNRSQILPRDGSEEILQRMLIYQGDRSIHVKYSLDDTLFLFRNNTLSPYLIFNYKNKQNIPRVSPVDGDRRIRFDQYENTGFMILNFYLLTSWTSIGNGWRAANYENKYFLLNKSEAEVALIKSYTDDLTGKIQTTEDKSITFPSLMPDNKLYITYSPIELLNTTTDKEKSKFSSDIFTQLDRIKSEVKETDNPILFIATPKQDI